ncbi:phospholipid carrier-dependent glycosyltransferase [Paenibacillus sp. MBLB4367]|uniref:phospholipid carrier-dependent glycosyltransferase n=1 Tax=Paenibacillus sp. MBLB4367 TaxID=3384767 RepID=UPI0039080C8B
MTFVKRIVLASLLLAAVAFGTAASMGALPGEKQVWAADSESPTANMVLNAGFEEGAADASTPQGWEQDVWDKGADVTKFRMDTGQVHAGSRSAVIENVRPNDAKLIQKQAVKPNTKYKLSAWVKASQVGASAKGANVSVLGVLDTSADVKDTNGQWQQVTLYGKTGAKQTELQVAVRLGGYGSLNTGTASFDDIMLEEVRSVPSGFKTVSFEPQEVAVSQTGPNDHVSVSLTPILLFAGLFVLLFGFVYIVLIRRKGLEAAPEGRIHALVAVSLAAAFLIRLLIAPTTTGYATDTMTFRAWADRLAEVGLSHFYTGEQFSDYPPGYMYVLYVIGTIRQAFGFGFDAPAYLLLIKLPAIIADILSAYMLFKIARSRLSAGIGFGLALLYAFAPAVGVNSAVWGQVDSFFALFLLLTLRDLFDRRYERASILFALAVLIKPQALIFTPVLLFGWYELRHAAGKLLRCGLLSLGTFVLLALPFAVHMPASWIFKLYGETLSSYPYATLNAFNLFALTGGNWVDQHAKLLFLSYQTWGYVAIAAALAVTLYVTYRGRALHTNRSVMFAGALLLIVTMFVLGVRMHERYMFPALILLPLLYIFTRDRRVLQLFLGFGLTHFVNVAYVLEASMQKQTAIDKLNGILMISSLANVLLYAYLIYVCVDMYVKGRMLVVQPLQLVPSEDGWAARAQGDVQLNETGKGRSLAAGQRGRKEKKQAGPPAKAAGEKGAGAPSGPASASRGDIRLTRKDGLWMAVITVIYAIVAFVNLGSATAPSTMWKPEKSGETIIVDFGAPKTIERVNLYTGIGDGKLKVEFSPTLASWPETGAQLADINYVKVFTWTSLQIRQDARYAKLTVESPGLELYELAFFEKDGQAALPFTTVKPAEGQAAADENAAKMFDEQAKVKYKPSYLDGTYFDEIYHARTAFEHLNSLPTYENTHPPLGKLMISVGIWLFGMNPFGWRIVGTLVGIAMLPLMYVFAKRIFRRTPYAIMATTLLAADFMHFAQTRIATIDVYGVFFIMLMYYFMYRYFTMNFYREPFRKTLVPLFWAGLFFGIGAAAKWIVIYGGAGLAFLLFLSLYERYREYEAAKGALASAYAKTALHDESVLEQCRSMIRGFPRRTLATLGWCCLFFGAIPIVIYALSFIPWLTADGGHYTLKGLIDAQKSMFDYHSKLVATHSFGSPWWEWPVIVKPIWYFGGQALLPEGMISSIVSMGNPAVWWVGLIAVPVTIWLVSRSRDKGMIVVLIAYFSQYVPWMLVTRLTFIYHYFAMVPFMILCITYCLKTLIEKKPGWKKAVYAYVGISVALFVLFYPILSGMIVSKSYAMYVLRWLPTWFFYS